MILRLSSFEISVSEEIIIGLHHHVTPFPLLQMVSKSGLTIEDTDSFQFLTILFVQQFVSIEEMLLLFGELRILIVLSSNTNKVSIVPFFAGVFSLTTNRPRFLSDRVERT